MKRLLLAIICYSITVTPCWAPEVSDHPRVMAAKADLAQAVAQRRRVIANWMPTVEATGEIGPAWTRDTINGVPDPSIRDRAPGPWSAEVRLTQPIIKDQLLIDELRVADATIAQRSAALDDVCGSISRETRAIAIEAQSTNDRLKVTGETQRQLKRVMADVSKRVKAKDVPEVDLLDVRDRLSRWLLAEGDTQQRAALAEHRRLALWGGAVSAARKVISQPVPPACASLEECRAAVLAHAPQLRQARLAKDTAAIQLAQRSRPRLPEVALQAGVKHSVQYARTYEAEEAYGKVTARVPLPWGAEPQADLESRRAAASAATYRSSASEDEVAGQASIAWTTIQLGTGQVALLGKRRAIAAQVLTATEAAYKAGKRDARAYLDAVEALAQIDLEQIRLTDERQIAHATLAYVTGVYACR